MQCNGAIDVFDCLRIVDTILGRLPACPVPCAVATPTPTRTPPHSPPAVSIGAVRGAPGAQVTLPFSLTMNSYQVVTIAPLVIGFDPGIASFNSCVSKVSSKAVDAGVPTDEPDRLRIVMEGGLSVIPDGPIVDCSFTIAAGAEPGRWS